MRRGHPTAGARTQNEASSTRAHLHDAHQLATHRRTARTVVDRAGLGSAEVVVARSARLGRAVSGDASLCRAQGSEGGGGRLCERSFLRRLGVANQLCAHSQVGREIIEITENVWNYIEYGISDNPMRRTRKLRVRQRLAPMIPQTISLTKVHRQMGEQVTHQQLVNQPCRRANRKKPQSWRLCANSRYVD